jgi:predicted amidohydrolase
VRLAAAQWPIEAVPTLDAWRAKLTRWIGEAASAGAELAIVPEYASMELTAALPPATAGDLAAQLVELQALLPAYRETYAALARRHAIAIVAGSFPEADAGGYRNRARIYDAGGERACVEKLQMTRFERETWGIAGGAGQVVVDLPFGRLGVAICYDAEFPLIVRRLVAAGADLIAVPSATDTRAGYHRVRVACQARALESQCAVVQAPTVGAAPWSLAMDANVGAAAVFTAPDRGLPDDGVLAIGAPDQPQWLIADLDLELIRRVRTEGQVTGHRDWALPAHLVGEVRAVR